MEKTAILILITAFLTAAVIIVIAVLYQAEKRRKIACGVKNCDSFMTKFVFRINLPEDEFIRRLKTKNAADVLPYEYNEAGSIIAFTVYNVKYEYRIRTQSVDESLILRVEAMAFHSRAAYYVNPFFIGKFDAVPLDFSRYGE